MAMYGPDNTGMEIVIDKSPSGPPSGLLEAVGTFLGGPIGGALGSIGSGLFGQRSERKARQYQEALDNSRYQRAAADMEKAGLNRILALGGPGSSFSGGSGSMPDLGSTMSSGLESQRKKQMQSLDMKAISTQIDNMVSQANASDAQAARDNSQAALNRVTTEGVKSENERRKVLGDAYEEMGLGAYILEQLLGPLGGGSAKAISNMFKGEGGKRK